MKTDEYFSLLHFTVHKSQALVPATPETQEWIEQQKHNTSVNFKLIEARDLGFHRCYFALLSFIYDRLPISFRSKVDKDNFYNFIKLIGKQYDTVYTLKDGTPLIQYKSISFGRMNQTKFREFVNEQLSTIYEEILIPLEVDYIMEQAQDEFQTFMDKLI